VTASGRRPAAFVDRDGTINVKRPEGHYVTSADELELLPRAGEAIALLNESGFKVIVITNQRGIALGRMTEADLAAIHRRLLDELSVAGARVDAIYHCPHGAGECDCRKPEVGLVLRAAREHPDLLLEESIVIGDSPSDVEVGVRLGLRTILVGGAAAAPVTAGVEGATSLWHAARMLREGRRGDVP
jgi:D-glycero-D-manno-heptose 1,7-bisphosphate phosphatase